MNREQKIARAKEILEYWHTTELLTQDNLPRQLSKASCSKKLENCVFYIRNIETLDGELERLKTETSKPFLHETVVFIGSVQRDAAMHELASALNLTDEEMKAYEVEKSTKNIACACIVLDQDCKYKKGTLSFSPVLWYLSQLKKNTKEKPQITSLEEEAKRTEDKIELIDPQREDFTIRVVDEIQDAIQKLFNKCECYTKCEARNSLYVQPELYQKQQYVPEESEDTSLSNCYYPNDIQLVIDNVDGLPETLLDYITCLDTQESSFGRIDLLDKGSIGDLTSTYKEMLSIINAPDGKWPSRFRPALMQQFAINEVRKETAALQEGYKPIFSVNGPPGTGKTTLLKEIVVNNIVERAKILASGPADPDDFFNKIPISEPRYEWVQNYYTLKNDRINNFGIVVASCNNAAVENISKELPVRKGLLDDLNSAESGISKLSSLFDPEKAQFPLHIFNDDERHREYNKEQLGDVYFSRFASALSKGQGDEAWGLISARLGKTSNVNEFKKQFLKGEYHEGENGSFSDGIIWQHKDTFAVHKEQFKKAQIDFKTQLDKVKQLKDEIKILETFSEQTADITQGSSQVLKQKRTENLNEIKELEDKILQEDNKRGLLDFLKKDKTTILNEKINEFKTRIELLKEANKSLEEEIIHRLELEKLKEQKQELEIKFNRNGICSYSQCNQQLIASAVAGNEDESCTASTTNPWTTQELDIERIKLFSAALTLQKEFVLSSKACRDNMKTLYAIFNNGEYSGDEQKTRYDFGKQREAIATACFQTLFLYVPVISTTFASVQRLFKDLKTPGCLGMLIVDEAGQALPQYAVGALYRCRQAVIVGDPKQVDPVVTDDLKIIRDSYREKMGTYTDKSNSVQKSADTINQYGATINDEWVGCPLVVHRRCQNPMFEISNRISYDGIMKQAAKTYAPNSEKYLFERSEWINIAGREKGNRNHSNEAQNQWVIHRLEEAFSVTNPDKPDIYIISPFTSVESGIRQAVERYCKYQPESNPLQKAVKGEYPNRWIDKNIGTVHRFQGREALNVIFLLGCDSSNNCTGAIKWVTKNIINVAATRAKARLCVVGDIKGWRANEDVKTMYNILTSYAFKELSKLGEINESTKASAEELVKQLPTSETFATSIKVDNDTSEDTGKVAGDPEIYNQAFLDSMKKLMPGQSTKDIDEQLKEFGIDEQYLIENRCSKTVQENIKLAAFLYAKVFKPCEQAGIEITDTSWCAINLAKALEELLFASFANPLKSIYPEWMLQNEKLLKDANDKAITCGCINKIIKTKIEVNEKPIIKKRGWIELTDRIEKGTRLRNACAHKTAFSKGQLNDLIDVFFPKDKDTEIKNESLLNLCKDASAKLNDYVNQTSPDANLSSENKTSRHPLNRCRNHD